MMLHDQIKKCRFCFVRVLLLLLLLFVAYLNMLLPKLVWSVSKNLHFGGQHRHHQMKVIVTKEV